MDQTIQDSIISRSVPNQNVRIPCPFCSSDRKISSQRIPVMSLDNDGDRIVYKCHHCDESGAISIRKKPSPPYINLRASKQEPVVDSVDKYTMTGGLVDYLTSRNISAQTASSAGVFSCDHFIRDAGSTVPCFGLPYSLGGISTGAKIRSYPAKGFAWVGGGGQGLWNIDNINPDEPIYIVEGEIDALTMIEMGFKNVVSVPNGAPMKVTNNAIDPTEDKKFQYLYKSQEILTRCKKIIIATDGDTAGNALADELARRLNRSKCWRINFPTTPESKDPNGYLCTKGQTAFIDLVKAPVPWPIAGLYEAVKYAEAVRSYYDKGILAAESTGYPVIDELYRVAPGQLSLVTGIPGSGKSEFVDQLMVNLALSKDWKFAICSFENSPDYHIVKLAEKICRASFFSSNRRMTPVQMEDAITFIKDHFLFIEQSSDTRASIDSVLERATAAVFRMGIRGLVIDPYNYLEKKSEGSSETDQAGSILVKTRQFSIAHGVHSWLIAHPQKLPRDSSGNVYVPKGYDVSGSANFFNVPDMGITLHRRTDHVEFHNWKTRFKWWGQVGMAKITYDTEISCYEGWDGDAEAKGWKRKFDEEDI